MYTYCNILYRHMSLSVGMHASCCIHALGMCNAYLYFYFYTSLYVHLRAPSAAVHAPVCACVRHAVSVTCGLIAPPADLLRVRATAAARVGAQACSGGCGAEGKENALRRPAAGPPAVRSAVCVWVCVRVWWGALWWRCSCDSSSRNSSRTRPAHCSTSGCE